MRILSLALVTRCFVFWHSIVKKTYHSLNHLSLDSWIPETDSKLLVQLSSGSVWCFTRACILNATRQCYGCNLTLSIKCETASFYQTDR